PGPRENLVPARGRARCRFGRPPVAGLPGGSQFPAPGVDHVSFFLSDPVSQRSSIQFAVGKDPSYVKAYNYHFATVSPFFGDWSPERWREGVIELSAQVCPDRILLRTEYYNDWLRPQKIHHLARGVVAREGEASWVLRFGRPQRSGSFTAQEL